MRPTSAEALRPQARQSRIEDRRRPASAEAEVTKLRADLCSARADLLTASEDLQALRLRAKLSDQTATRAAAEIRDLKVALATANATIKTLEADQERWERVHRGDLRAVEKDCTALRNQVDRLERRNEALTRRIARAIAALGKDITPEEPT